MGQRHMRAHTQSRKNLKQVNTETEKSKEKSK